MGCTTSTPAATAKPAPMATKEVQKVAESNGTAKSASPAGKLDKASIIFVLGGPGSGKGTQCAKIIDKYPGVKHFSAGDLLRDAVKNGNTELEAIMKEGKLVPVEVTIKLLKDAMLASDGSVFLIDGFPRALDQADVFEKQIKSCNMVLAFDCPEETMRERLLARGQSSGRADDNEETIVKRFHTFLEQSKPVIDLYKTKGKCVEISAVDAPDDVFTHVQKSISERLPELAATGKSLGAAVPVSAPAPASLPTDSKVIFVLGGPGSGKGTQCDKILKEYADCGVHHFSAGDLLRDAVKNGNTELEAIMKEGKLVPMEVTIRLLKDAMIASGANTFLVDGFPRAWDQAECFESTIQPCSAVLFFDCSEEAMRERLLKRGETSGRADDNEATIVKRFHTFVEQSKPVVDEYKTQGKCHEISAMRSPDEVFVDVKGALDVLLRGTAPPVAQAPADAPPAASEESKGLPEGSKIVFVLGGPGSGKGTQCDKIISRYEGVQHFSAGDLLRDAVKNGNTELEAIMKEGKLVPMEVTIRLLKDAMIASGSSVFLIDGFPRAWDQAECFESTIQPCTAVLFFDCSEGVMRERLLKRGETSGRADDNEETIVKRFHTFVEQSKPVVDEYKTQGKCFEVSAEQTPDEVFEGVQKALDGILTVAVAAE